MTAVLAFTASAGGKGELQKYFGNTAQKVKATVNPAEKRAILQESFQAVSGALEIMDASSALSQADQAGLNQFKASLRDKQDELAGLNGYQPVPDGQLNAFSDYVVQDMEQADETITISLVAALLILILAVLIF
jgi:hypothetical protein